MSAQGVKYQASENDVSGRDLTRFAVHHLLSYARYALLVVLGVAERLIPTTHLSMRPSKAEKNKLLTERTNAGNGFEPVSTFFIRIFLSDLLIKLSK